MDEIPLEVELGDSTGSGSTDTNANTRNGEPGLNPEDKEGEGEGQPEPLTPKTWRKEFSGPEAKVVRDAVGGVVICLRNLDPRSPSTATATATEQDVEEIPEWKGLKTFLEAVGSVKGVMDEERGGLGDVLGLVVLVGRERESGVGTAPGAGVGSGDPDEVDGLGEEEVFSVPWWEDKLFDLGLVGFEVVNWDPREVENGEERNRFGGMFSSLFFSYFGWLVGWLEGSGFGCLVLRWSGCIRM